MTEGAERANPALLDALVEGLTTGQGRNAAPQAAAERMNQLYTALRYINQAIVRLGTRAELFARVCQMLVEPGGFRMAWVGWYDPDTQRLLPVAESGDEGGYLQSIQIYVDDRPEGRGPTGIAFRENRTYICNDMFSDPATLPWRPDLARRGFRASAVFPIRLHGKVEGTLSVYAEQPGFFQEGEISLLTQAAADLSFALDTLAERDETLLARALAEREQRFTNSLIESMPGIFYLYDATGRFLRWNQNFESTSGYGSREIARMHPLDFFDGAEKQLLSQRIAEVFERGESSVEALFVSKDGRRTPYFFTGKRISFDGETCLVGVGVDISKRKEAEDALSKSEQRYRTTLDNILEGCQLIGFDWRYLYLNDAAAVHNRRPNQELLGQRMPDAWPGIDQTEVFRMLKRCLEERLPLHQETEFVFPDGTSGWFDVRTQPVPEGIFVLSIDISDRKRAETALHELNESLEQKVRERTLDLKAALERAESADRIKSAFLATMSHELRTPLNSIIGFSGILLRGMAGPLNPEQSKQLGMVKGSAGHLLELINDVLDLSKIEAGEFEVRLAPFDLRESIERVAASVRPLAEQKGLTLNVVISEPLEPLESDRRRVEQILLNLLHNAIKFTDQGTVTLSADMAHELLQKASGTPERVVRLQVADTGIGIQPQDLPTLFRPFQQIDAGLGRQHEGTGLGLAICLRLCKLLGGDVRVESRFQHGSVFTAILPVVPSEAGA